MSTDPIFVAIGEEKEKIDVRLSYRIVRLFSEGLYASSNKAIEELVANAFDAGALRVAVMLSGDFHNQDSTIAVLDDGEGMGAEGLKQHWLIGKSLKRDLGTLPRGRNQIGKFGIGKLATYVLANRLSHISKKGGKYFSTSMDYKEVDARGEEEVEPKSPIKIALRELSEAQARDAVKPWTSSATFAATKIELFGAKAPDNWTLAILSDLKAKVHEIKRGTLAWVLRTALPLRDDFAIFLDGDRLEPSKAGKGRIKRYILGKDIKELSKPSAHVEASEDANQTDKELRFGLDHGSLGRITGYAETYKDLLTGKSDEIGRSHGFFVYVLGRLINVRDGHFGISPDELRHGSFGRIRVVVHMDGLDDHLQSDREHIREGPILEDAQNVLRAVFNKIRADLEKDDAGEDPGARLARNLASSPGSVSRRPIIELARAVLEGKSRSRYLLLPPKPSAGERDSLLARLEARSEKPEEFVEGLDFVYDSTATDGIARFDAATSRLRINGLHPFVGAFFDEFTSKASGLPLELFAMAEVLLEAHLFQAGVHAEQINSVLESRDQLLRYVAQQSGRRTAMTVASALREARNDEDRLEQEVVAAFESLGFGATRVGGQGKPDGIATANLSADSGGVARRYSVSLEAKSKEKDGAKLSTKALSPSTIARHRDEFNCDHAIVVAPAFDHTPGKDSTLSKDLKTDRDNSKAKGATKTTTAIHIDDLARLVQLRPVKRLGLDRLRELFVKCSLPEECKEWIDRLESEEPARPPYELIIRTIHTLQEQFKQSSVRYSGLRVALAMATPPFKVETDDALVALCKAMSAMAGNEIISATDLAVELNQSPANVLAAIESATKAHMKARN